MKTVWRYEIPADDQWHEVNLTSVPLHAAMVFRGGGFGVEFWGGNFEEYSALLCELPKVRTMAWDSPGHMPWVGVSLTPCPDVVGAPIRLENYSCWRSLVQLDAGSVTL